MPNREPTVITAGDSVEWTRIVADYRPADGWRLSYVVVLADKRVYATVTDDGADEYTATVSATDVELSAIVGATESRLVGFVEGSGVYAGERHTVYEAPLTILPNPAETTLDDMRSPAEIELAALNAVILELTTAGTSAYSIAGRSATKLDLPNLYKRQAVLEARIRQEKSYRFRSRRVAFV